MTNAKYAYKRGRENIGYSVDEAGKTGARVGA